MYFENLFFYNIFLIKVTYWSWHYLTEIRRNAHWVLYKLCQQHSKKKLLLFLVGFVFCCFSHETFSDFFPHFLRHLFMVWNAKRTWTWSHHTPFDWENLFGKYEFPLKLHCKLIGAWPKLNQLLQLVCGYLVQHT